MKRRVSARIAVLFSLCFYFLFFLSFLGLSESAIAANEKRPKAFTMGTSPTAGALYRMGIGYGEIIKKHMNIPVTVQATEGGGFNISLVSRGEMDLGFCQSVQSYDAARGVGLYEKMGKQPIRNLWVTYPAPIALCTHENSDIKTPADIRGKQYMFVLKGATAMTLYGDALLEAYGMTRKDCIAQVLSGSTELIEAVKEKRTAVWHYPGSLVRHAVWEQITQQAAVRFISIGKEQAASIHKKYPQFSFIEFPANIYRNQNYTFNTASWWSYFFCHENLSDELAYEITKTCWENRKELLPLDPLFEEFNIDTALDSNMPFHAGAIRYFKEKGVWKAEHDQLQKNLLQEIGKNR